MDAATRKRKKFQGPAANRYAELVAELPPRPIHDKSEYNRAVEMIGRLVGYRLNSDQEDYLEALTVFVERYQAKYDPLQSRLANINGIDVLRSLTKEHGMSGADLSRLLGASRSLGPMLLRGERSLTAQHARILGEHFQLDPGVFVR